MNAIITIDQREPQHVKNLTWDGCITQIATLEYGDFSIMCPDGSTLLIERKTPSDLLGSIKDGRLSNQVAGLVGAGAWPYLLIEIPFHADVNGMACYRDGDSRNYDTMMPDGTPAKSTNWQWVSIQGQLLSIQEMGCAIIYDPDPHNAIKQLIGRSRNDVKVKPRREPYIFSPKEQVLMALPGIGSKKALEFLELFNDNVALALMALTAEYDGKDRIPGWGKKSRDSLVELLGYPLEVKI